MTGRPTSLPRAEARRVMREPWPEMRALYEDDRAPIAAIAERFGVATVTIWANLRRHGIHVRSRTEQAEMRHTASLEQRWAERIPDIVRSALRAGGVEP